MENGVPINSAGEVDLASVGQDLVSEQRTLKVYVSDVNEAPGDITLRRSVNNSFMIDGDPIVFIMEEDRSILNYTVGYMSASDPDTYATDPSWSALDYYFKIGENTFSKTSADGRFKIDGNRIAVARTLDYETPSDRSNEYTIAVKDADGGYDATQDERIRVNIHNREDRLPEISIVDNVVNRPQEGLPPGAFVMDIDAVDPDGTGSQFFYEIANSASVDNAFAIDSEGRVTVIGALDYELRSSYNLRIKVTEADSQQSSYRDVLVEVADGRDHIATINGFFGSGFSYTAEGTRDGYFIGTIFNLQFGNGYYVEDRHGTQVAIYNHFNVNTIEGYEYESIINSAGFTTEVRLHRLPGTAYPIVFDLDDDGVEITPFGRHNIVFDIDNDGYRQRTDWVGADDGLLALDRNGDGVINNGSEISFVDDLPGAKTDLEGLAAFDSNGDGVFDAGDARFGEFQIWRDVNQDAISQESELMSLTQAGIVALDLTPVPTGVSVGDPVDALILNTSTYTRADGSTGEIGDAAFRYSRVEEDAAAAPGVSAPEADPAEPIAPEQETAPSAAAAVNESEQLEGLFNSFLGKIRTGEVEIDAERYEASFAPMSGGEGAHDAGMEASAAFLNRFIDAMASFETDSRSLDAKMRDRASFAERFTDIAAY